MGWRSKGCNTIFETLGVVKKKISKKFQKKKISKKKNSRPIGMVPADYFFKNKENFEKTGTKLVMIGTGSQKKFLPYKEKLKLDCQVFFDSNLETHKALGLSKPGN